MSTTLKENRPLVLDHQMIIFETAQSCNPGKGHNPKTQSDRGNSKGCGKANGVGFIGTKGNKFI
ncbi:hypothetical protein [Metabacillus litoralis]|uniref:hypothetical protein n=1 Tax=Metabacillus litoralis TaxID=152268 RepID=UPI001CFC9A7A|nr:hypothetical protein [Metabacillus litoralis]